MNISKEWEYARTGTQIIASLKDSIANCIIPTVEFSFYPVTSYSGTAPGAYILYGFKDSLQKPGKTVLSFHMRGWARKD